MQSNQSTAGFLDEALDYMGLPAAGRLNAVGFGDSSPYVCAILLGQAPHVALERVAWQPIRECLTALSFVTLVKTECDFCCQALAKLSVGWVCTLTSFVRLSTGAMAPK